MAVGADYILVPEVPIDLPHLIGVLKRRRAAGKKFGVVIVAEGARFPDQEPLALDRRSRPVREPPAGRNLRSDRRGHHESNRASRLAVWSSVTFSAAGRPTAADRVLATRMGLAASQLVLQRRFGTVVTFREGQIIETALTPSSIANRSLDLSYYDEAAAFFY